ncbi:carboxylesterase family protein [Nocardioidaceae bacterium]|nr:carboxylesterase family protein [Nocardioidaceae bacterium]
MSLSTRDTTTEAPQWRTPAGTVRGWRDGDVLRATGIRYATAERFAEPVVEPVALEPIDATSWAPACPQPGSPTLEAACHEPMGGMTYDEDCLRVSVTVPADMAPGETLPVMVWIHGGAYRIGAPDAPIFDAAPLVAEQRVVWVAVGYRLGVLGYLGLDGTPANLGLLDQLEALRWVRRNVAAFGGDDADVTLIGQSAGGDAVAHLMVAQGTERLFERAVVMSAPLGITTGREKMTAAMVEAVTGSVADPRTAPVEDLVAAQDTAVAAAAPFGLVAAMPFGVEYGRHPLPPEAEMDAAWRAVAPDVELLIGATDREVALYAAVMPPLVRLAKVPGVGTALVASMVRVLTWRIFGGAAASFGARHRRAGGRGNRYSIVWGSPGNPFDGAHVIDMPLLFGTKESWGPAPMLDGLAWSEVEAAGRTVRRLWGDFARSGTLPRTRRWGLISVRGL